MYLQEIYRALDGSLFAIERFSNQAFFRYRRLSAEEITQLVNHSYSSKIEIKAGSSGRETSEPAKARNTRQYRPLRKTKRVISSNVQKNITRA